MSDIAIRVDSIGKRYRIGERESYRALRDVLARGFTAPLRALRDRGSARRTVVSNFIWALKDVSFDISRGETVGIIGRNGAGKSTLLKVLSRITVPTEGYAEVHGKIGALLEVGTGFHPELTGRENVYLNGAILGMSKKEIDRKFEEIVAFAEVEKFIDTPVKRYSSGMSLRLAFAVAAHLETEVVIVDEVLAVGDYEFQRKCFGKMGDVGREGRTVVVVSHNMPSIVNLCKRAILLNGGQIVADGEPTEVVRDYLATGLSIGGEVVWDDLARAPGTDTARLKAVRIFQDGVDAPTADVDISKEVHVQITYANLQEGSILYSGIWLKDQIGTFVLSSTNHKSISSTDDPWNQRPHPIGTFQSVCRIPGNFLNDGLYSITAIVGNSRFESEIQEESVLSFRVHDSGKMKKEYFGSWAGPVVRPRLAWNTERVEAHGFDLDRG